MGTLGSQALFFFLMWTRRLPGFFEMKLKKRLEDSLSAGELACLVGAYDMVGDMAIIIIPAELAAKEQLIAEAVLGSNKKIRVVAKRAGNYGGEFRTIPLQVLAGENRKETEVVESGVRLLVNPETVYYSVRSGNERRRLAALVQPGESVLVLFSGIAPFPLIIARYSEAKSVVGIEKNPEAHAYARENLRRNKKQKNIHLYLGDVREVVPALAATYDRVIMPLPAGGEEFLPCGLQAVRAGGVLHFYALQRQELFAASCEKIAAACAAVNRTVLSTAITRCGHCAPKTYRICIDARIS
jgi:tRNA (guanine37-N1)-methyltransferase